jgi:tetratricopeptide (TPR) repeat protein
LALVQAGAYLRTTNTSVDEYLQHYDETWAALMHVQNQYPLQTRAERSVLTTWKMSYQQVRAVKPEATDLLDLWAFLSPGDIWYELVASVHKIGAGILSHKLTFRHILSLLSNYSLATPDVQNEGFSIHPVVHAWCLHNLITAEDKQRLCSRAMRLVVGVMPSSKSTDDLIVARRLLPHARMVAGKHLQMQGYKDLEYELHKIADFLQDWESSQVVEHLYMRALRGKEEALGVKHMSTLDTVNNLGILYGKQGKPKEAEEMYVRALRGREEALGAKHTSTLDTVYNLGNLHRDNGEVGKARQMYARAAEGYKQVEGDHEADISYLREQLSLLETSNGRARKRDRLFRWVKPK